MLYSSSVINLQTALLLTAITAPILAWPVARLHEASTPLSRFGPQNYALASRLLRPDLGPLFQGEAAAQLDASIRSFRAERLNLGGARALAVQPTGDELCSPTGNCAFWIIDLQHRRIILRADEVQTFASDPAPSHGPPDIITSMHGSAFESDLTRWHYEGTQYMRQSCALADYADADGHAYKQPKFTPHSCLNQGN